MSNPIKNATEEELRRLRATLAGAHSPSPPREPSPEVGYKRPPKSGQFKKGQSGNPKGRPKKPPLPDALAETVLAVAGQNVSIKNGGETISLEEAVVRKSFETATKGNAHAQRTVLQELRRAHTAKEAEATAEAEKIAEEVRFWIAYRDEEREAIREAQEAGEELPLIIPHPDDLVIDALAGVSVAGPRTVEEHVDAVITQKFRRAHLHQWALDVRLGAVARFPKRESEESFSLTKAFEADRMLPRRLRLGPAMMDEMKALERLPKRALLKATRAAWAELGVARRRGETMGTIAEVRPAAELLLLLFGGDERAEIAAKALGPFVKLHGVSAARGDEFTDKITERAVLKKVIASLIKDVQSIRTN